MVAIRNSLGFRITLLRNLPSLTAPFEAVEGQWTSADNVTTLRSSFHARAQEQSPHRQTAPAWWLHIADRGRQNIGFKNRVSIFQVSLPRINIFWYRLIPNFFSMLSEGNSTFPFTIWFTLNLSCPLLYLGTDDFGSTSL